MTVSRRDFVIAGVGSACALATTGVKMAEAQTTQGGPQHKEPQAARQSMLPDRMPELSEGNMTPAQKQAAAEFSGRKALSVPGPFVALLRSPEVMLRTKALGEYLYSTKSVPSKLKEFAILITARQWTQQYTWDIHYPIALNAGLDQQVAQALAEGSRPEGMTPEEQIVYEFCTELHRNQSVSDPAYARVAGRYGEEGVIDLLSICGFYTFMSMILNTARTALPKGAATPLPSFPR